VIKWLKARREERRRELTPVIGTQAAAAAVEAPEWFIGALIFTFLVAMPCLAEAETHISTAWWVACGVTAVVSIVLYAYAAFLVFEIGSRASAYLSGSLGFKVRILGGWWTAPAWLSAIERQKQWNREGRPSFRFRFVKGARTKGRSDCPGEGRPKG